MNTDTPPILYHSFKHHLKTTVEWIKLNKGKWDADIEQKLKSIGESQLDYYIGEYTEQDIKQLISERLFLCGCFDFDSYLAWVNKQGSDYRTIRLDDNSEWTLRIVDQTNYIHIHPARYTIHTRRIKANILKTVVCALLFGSDLNYNDINTIRIERLGLSPIDITKKHEELNNVFLLLRDNISFRGMPKSLIDFIEHTRKRPGMFFGSLDGQAFNRLHAYILGYEMACKIHGIEETPKFFLTDFNKYVADYYQSSASVNCFTLILVKCYNNELQAFNTFYKLFDAFCKESGLK